MLTCVNMCKHVPTCVSIHVYIYTCIHDHFPDLYKSKKSVSTIWPPESTNFSIVHWETVERPLRDRWETAERPLRDHNIYTVSHKKCPTFAYSSKRKWDIFGATLYLYITLFRYIYSCLFSLLWPHWIKAFNLWIFEIWNPMSSSNFLLSSDRMYCALCVSVQCVSSTTHAPRPPDTW